MARPGWLAGAGGTRAVPGRHIVEQSLQQAIRAFERLLADRLGSDFRWPRLLPTELNAAGLVDVDASAALTVTGNAGAVNEFWRLNLTELAPDIIDAGLIDSPCVITQAVEALADPAYLDLTLAFVSVWGRRRGTSPERADDRGSR
jgi:hypothetical protein